MDTSNQQVTDAQKLAELEERTAAHLEQFKAYRHEREQMYREMGESIDDIKAKMHTTVSEIEQDLAVLDQADAEAEKEFDALLADDDDTQDEQPLSS